VVEVPSTPSLWQELIFRFFFFVAPTYRINVGKYVERTDQDSWNWVTRDEAHRQWIKTAPHRLTRFTVRFFHNLRALITGCFDAAPKIEVPVLVLYAANDIYIKPARVEAFFARLGSHEKELQFFPESYHLLLHDYDKSEALARIEDWLLRQIEASHQPRVTVPS
jgi:alpha-beta hydrolase superfamily lysophospholipase